MSDLRLKNLREHSGFTTTPEGWTDTTVGDICNLGRGRVISQEEINDNPGPYPVFSSQTRNNGQMGSLATFDLAGEFVTWTTDGENAGTVFFRSGQFNCTNVCGTLFPKNLAEIDLRFLTYQLGKVAKRYVSYIGNPKLMNGVMATVGLILPSPKVQRRIAEILSTLDGAIAQTEALIAKHQQIKAGLMHDLFTRGVTPDGHLRPTRELAPDLYKESPLGWMPKEWEVGRLSQYLDPLAGIKPGPFGSSLTKDNYVSAGFRIYGQEQVIAGSLEIGDYYIAEAKFLEMATFEVLADDVLISLVGTVGCVLVVKPPFERGIINPRLMRLRPARGVVLSGFLKHLLLSANVRRQLEILAGGGTMPVINGKIIRRLVIPLLPLDEQARMVQRVDAIDDTIASSSETLANLRQQKHGLMHDLLTGKVRVKIEQASAGSADG